MQEGFVVRFRGVRGQYPVPGETTLKFGGNTPCVEVWVGGRLIVLDAGTGIVSLGDDLMAWQSRVQRPLVMTLLLSHTHHDHSQGFPFFTPAYRGTSKLYMFGPKTFDQDLEQALARAMLPPTFPISLDELAAFKIISNIDENETLLIGPEHQPQIRNIHRERIDNRPDLAQIRFLRSGFHPGGGTTLFRIDWQEKSVVYASDTEGVEGGDTALIAFAQGCDLLIHDAQYTMEEYLGWPAQGWGHSTPEMAILVAQRASARQLVLYHHDPAHDDTMLDEMQAAAQAQFSRTTMAYEGLTIRL